MNASTNTGNSGVVSGATGHPHRGGVSNIHWRSATETTDHPEFEILKF